MRIYSGVDIPPADGFGNTNRLGVQVENLSNQFQPGLDSGYLDRLGNRSRADALNPSVQHVDHDRDHDHVDHDRSSASLRDPMSDPLF